MKWMSSSFQIVHPDFYQSDFETHFEICLEISGTNRLLIGPKFFAIGDPYLSFFAFLTILTALSYVVGSEFNDFS